MDRRVLLITIFLIAIFSITNATVFIYRWMNVAIEVAPPAEATGAACSGFYSAVDQPGIDQYLPPAGTNAYDTTYNNNRIEITPGKVVCYITEQYVLYESIHVYVPITVGQWYIHDFYGFGYYSRMQATTIEVTLTVEQAVDPTIVIASLIVYNAATGEYIGSLPLTRQGATITFTLSDYEAVRFDLVIDAIASGSTEFRVGFYVQQLA